MYIYIYICIYIYIYICRCVFVCVNRIAIITINNIAIITIDIIAIITMNIIAIIGGLLAPSDVDQLERTVNLINSENVTMCKTDIYIYIYTHIVIYDRI